MVIWGFEIGDSHLRFRRFCIKIIIKGIQKSEITDYDTGGCGMWGTLVPNTREIRSLTLPGLKTRGFYIHRQNLAFPGLHQAA